MSTAATSFTYAEALECAKAEYMITRGDWDWLCCSRGPDGGYHLRQTEPTRAKAQAWQARQVRHLTSRILTGETGAYRTASGRLELL